MSIQFSKYHGTGNDFVIIDDRDEVFDIYNAELINQICSRRFGVGADGLILLRDVEGYDFQMVYFNSDGNQSSMCGNGGRCIVHFAYVLGIFDNRCSFLAIDGAHEAYVLEDGSIKLKMNDVDRIAQDDDAWVLDTGSPHYVLTVKDVKEVNVQKDGASIRYSEKYAPTGINVNFVECRNNDIRVATYERGVEDETYSCGTGATAAAIAIFEKHPEKYSSPISIGTKGGHLKVHFSKGQNQKYTDIWLEGPAVNSFTGVF